MLFTIITLLSALSISAVAAFYSIIGLMAIFAGAAIPIAIMGSVLEVGKIITAVWLHRHWKTQHKFVKGYLTTAVIVLMLITSMGIYGFLSKAHLDATSSHGDISAKIEQVTEQIEYKEEQIEQQEKILEQLDSAIDKYIENNYISRGLQKRDEQSEIRERVNGTIQNLEDDIQSLRSSQYEYKSTLRNIEVEVGPVRYVAELIYGDEAESNLDNAVRIVIIALIFVFDPLAILLLIASQISLYESRKPGYNIESDKKKNKKPVTPDEPTTNEERERIRRKKNRLQSKDSQM